MINVTITGKTYNIFSHGSINWVKKRTEPTVFYLENYVFECFSLFLLNVDLVGVCNF